MLSKKPSLYALTIVCLALALTFGAEAIAASSSGATMGAGNMPQGGGGMPPRNTAMEEAVSSCIATVTKKDSFGGPDRTEMDACMKKKGYDAPPPPQGAGGQPSGGQQPSFGSFSSGGSR